VTLPDPSVAVAGDTTGATSNGDGSCQNGNAAPDAVYELTAAVTGVLDLTLNSAADLGVYVRTACGDVASELGCADLDPTMESLTVPVKAGDKVFIFVDGYDNTQFGPYTLDVKSRATVCGDSVVEGIEQCDPPDGMTCDASCKTVPEAGHCADGIDNDGNNFIDCEDPACAADAACPIATECSAAKPAVASNAGDTTSTKHDFVGTCVGGAANEQLYSYSNAVPGVLSATLSGGAVNNLGLYVRTTCADGTTEIACDNHQTAPDDEVMSIAVPGANKALTLFVDGASMSDAGPFTFTTTFTPATEIEPNDDAAHAGTPSNNFVGILYPAADSDWVKVAVPGPTSTITAETVDLGTGACAAKGEDTKLEIYDTDGTTVIDSNDDGGAGYCSLLTVPALKAGTYYVRVFASDLSSSPTMGYKLNVTVTP
jgi:hypothetical protein